MDTTPRPTLAGLGSDPFLETVRRSRVLPVSRILSIAEKLDQGTYPAQAISLAAQLVSEGDLTRYQARRLLHGRWEDLVVDRYVILDLLGEGSTGLVFKAHHQLMGRTVAIKFISGSYLQRSGSDARFLREMRLASRLDHPNIVRTLDAAKFGDIPYIVMQYIPGRDLGHVFHEVGPFLPLRVVAQGFQVARGLAHAHARGVVHRDIKPSNLLLGDDGHVRILDFGHGAFLESELGDAGGFATTEGCAVGTVEYMSPEQAAGRKADGRSDLFSLGCVIYHLITGRIPFPGDSKVECLASRIKGRPVPIELLEANLPAGLAEVVDRLMANRPDDRYPTALEAAQALKAILVAARNGGSREVPERQLVPAVSRSESDFILVTEADPDGDPAPVGEPGLTLEEPTPELVGDPGGDSEVIAGSMEPEFPVEPNSAERPDEAIDLEQDGLELWEAPVAAPVTARKSPRRSVRSLVALVMATAATILVGLIAQAMGR